MVSAEITDSGKLFHVLVTRTVNEYFLSSFIVNQLTRQTDGQTDGWTSPNTSRGKNVRVLLTKVTGFDLSMEQTVNKGFSFLW